MGGNMRTPNIHSEIVCSLSPTNNVRKLYFSRIMMLFFRFYLPLALDNQLIIIHYNTPKIVKGYLHSKM